MPPTNYDLRLAGVCGLIFVVLSVAIAFMVPIPAPPLGSTAETVVAYYAAHREPYLLGNYLATLALLPSAVFLAVFVSLVRRAQPDGWLWLLVLIAVAVLGAVSLGDVALNQGIAYCTVEGDLAVAGALSDVDAMAFSMAMVAGAGYAAAAGWAILQLKVLPRWMGWLALVVAVLSVVASAGTVVTRGPIAAGGPMTILAFCAVMFFCAAQSVLFLLGRVDRSSAR